MRSKVFEWPVQPRETTGSWWAMCKQGQPHVVCLSPDQQCFRDEILVLFTKARRSPGTAERFTPERSICRSLTEKKERMKVRKKEILCDESCGKKKPCATKTARKNGSQLLISKSCFFQANPGFEENCKDREIIWEYHLSSDTSPRARQSLPTSLRSCPARPRDLFSFEKKHTWMCPDLREEEGREERRGWRRWAGRRLSDRSRWRRWSTRGKSRQGGKDVRSTC